MPPTPTQFCVPLLQANSPSPKLKNVYQSMAWFRAFLLFWGFFSERDASDEVAGSGLLPATAEEKKIHRGLIIKQKWSGTEERNSPVRLFL